MDDVERLKEIVGNVAEKYDIEVFGIDIKPYRGTVNIELFIDHPEGGISLDECAAVNQKIVAGIDKELLFDDNYTLSVSSPGIGWPLTTGKDFRRVKGYDIEVMVKDDQGISFVYKGVLEKATEEEIIIRNDTEITLLLKHVAKAKVLI